MTFYRALAVIPGSRELANLELDTDRARQVQKLLQFRDDPRSFKRHLTYSQQRFLFGPEDNKNPKSG
ncbi:hypothetical protein [Agromyces sp. NPDC057865]|uniref:hypothetical protein n=1 Tax=Agromyces sp. NPDC057865 TaxID=3346267 RepID=UPI00367337C3